MFCGGLVEVAGPAAVFRRGEMGGSVKNTNSSGVPLS
jgi:hypothetical protein